MALDMKKLFGDGGGGPRDRMGTPKSVSFKSVSIGSDGSDGDERTSAAQAIIKAVRANDPEALDLALEDHYRACEDAEDTEDEGSESDDDGGGMGPHGSDSMMGRRGRY